MTLSKNLSIVLRLLFFLFSISIILFNIYQAFGQNIGAYTRFDYWNRFKSLEDLYNSSQYIQKHPKAIITDDVVYSYNAGKFIQGINPILINPEVPTLGKYIIAVSILIFNNESIFNLIACIVLFPLLFILSYIIFKNYMIAMIPPLLFSFEKIFANQLIITPTLDIYQLDFLIISFIFLLLALSKKKNFMWMFAVSSFFFGFFISTKFFASGFIIAATSILTCLLLARKKLLKLFLCLLIAPTVLLLSYSKLFFLGYSLREVLGVQKWIFLYNTGHLGNPPFTVWDLILFNKMHTWWAGNAIIPDAQWNFLWPVILIISLLTIFILGKESIVHKKPVTLIMIWAVFYLMSLNVGQISSRYFFILIPFLYILTVFGLKRFLTKMVPKMQNKIGKGIFLVVLLSLFLFKPIGAYAFSPYVLPYPGVMPGNKLYVAYLLLEKLQSYYSFGDFAQFKYNLSRSDKYLVETKTLFEYNQYPLALIALEKSNGYFARVAPTLKNAKHSGKNISEKEEIFYKARKKHIEVLQKIKTEVPEKFIWADEKKKPINLSLWQILDLAIVERTK